MPNSISHYEQGIDILLERLGKEHKHYADVLTLQARLRKNDDDTTRLGENEVRRTEWAHIVDGLNRIALEISGQGFDELCSPLRISQDTQQTPTPGQLSVADLRETPDTAAIRLPCCPFIAGPKITDPRLFVGRKVELQRLTGYMEGVQPISLNMVGQRRIGKSSLLYHFFQTWEQRVRIPQRYVVIYLSLQEAAAQTEASLYKAIAQRLVARPAVQRRAELGQVLAQQPLTREKFSAVLRQFRAVNLLPVLCLDEFEALLRYPRQFDDGFFDALRALMDENALLMMVASRRPLDVYRRQHRLTSSFFNVGHLLVLGELTDEEAGDLVRLPASTTLGAPAALSLDEQRLARHWAGCHPCLLQLAASALCQARQEGKDRAWARARFQTEARRIPRNNMPLHRLTQPLRWLVWDVPLRLGRLAKGIGGTVDEVTAWIIGMAIVLVVILAVLGVLNYAQVLELLRRALGG